jgi:hypothetical protein
VNVSDDVHRLSPQHVADRAHVASSGFGLPQLAQRITISSGAEAPCCWSGTERLPLVRLGLAVAGAAFADHDAVAVVGEARVDVNVLPAVRPEVPPQRGELVLVPTSRSTI